jgi:hypothetical protein
VNSEETTNPVEVVKPDVQHVVASRADSPANTLESAVQGTATVLTSGGAAFFSTLKRMLLLAVVLALAAAWWAEEGAIARGVAAAVIVFIPVAVVGLLLAGQRATVAIALETWRQTGLARKLLNLLMDEVAKPAEGEAAPAVRLPIGEACLRLKVAIVDWKASNTASSSLIRRSQQWIGGLIEKILSSAFQSYVGQGGVHLSEVRHDLSITIDDLVADRVRRRSHFAVFAAVFASICWAFGVAYLLHVLARG